MDTLTMRVLTIAIAASALAACAFDSAGLDQGLDPRTRDPAPPVIDVPMRTILGGDFHMGCNDGVDQDCPADEQPYHSVTLSPYEIDRTEVSQGAYLECIQAQGHPCTAPVYEKIDPIDRGHYPVVGVSWTQAAQYCAWKGKRLPTEAEWERAARGEDGRMYPWGNEKPDCDRANYGECGMVLRATGESEDGLSPHGVVDMAGNALEWVADWYSADAYKTQAGTDPQGPPGPVNGLFKVVRGGSYTSDAFSLRTTTRGPMAPQQSWANVGFRCAKSLMDVPGPE